MLSPKLFTIYTNDSPPSLRVDNVNLTHVDDVTQIIQYPGKSKLMAQRPTIREIEPQTAFEKSWKIKTNTNKFTVLRLGGEAKIRSLPTKIYTPLNTGDVY